MLQVAPVLAGFIVFVSLAGCLQDNGFFGPATVEPEDYLTDDDYTEWVIEIDYAPGHRPSSSAISLLKSRMADLVHKDTIQVQVDDQLTEGGGSWNVARIVDASDDNQDTKTSGSRVVTHVMYVAGHSSEDSGDGRVLGVALSDHATIVLFADTIEDTANIRFSKADIEEAVLVHEFGHILGLVDNGIPMVNPHSDGGAHSDNTNSVMHASIRTGDIVNFITGRIPTSFDADDKRDICNAGGRC